MGPFSFYDYVSFILPGSTMLFTVVVGWYGWPWKEPGATALAGILAAGFVVGNVLTGAANWIQPLILGHVPWHRTSGLWGQFGNQEHYAGRRDEITAKLNSRYRTSDVEAAYRQAQAELRDRGKAEMLDKINPQLGFCRAMVAACVVSFAIELSLWLGSHTHLLPSLWLPLFAAGAFVFGYRFRRFWRWYGDWVLRGFLLVADGPGPDTDEAAQGDNGGTAA